jgi:hypothetical protein
MKDFPGAVSPRGTLFAFTVCFCDAQSGRNDIGGQSLFLPIVEGMMCDVVYICS